MKFLSSHQFHHTSHRLHENIIFNLIYSLILCWRRLFERSSECVAMTDVPGLNTSWLPCIFVVIKNSTLEKRAFEGKRRTDDKLGQLFPHFRIHILYHRFFGWNYFLFLQLQICLPWNIFMTLLLNWMPKMGEEWIASMRRAWKIRAPLVKALTLFFSTFSASQARFNSFDTIDEKWLCQPREQ